MSVFGFCNNKCKHEVYTKDETYTKEEINNSLAECKLKGDFAVLTGSIECSGNLNENAASGICTFTNVDVDFPEGFTSENCIVTSIGGRNLAGTAYSYSIGGVTNSQDMAWGTEPIRVSLGVNSKIKIGAGNLAENSKTRHYKVVLMKI